MEQNKILVSVIMPAYNCEKYISKAIDSVLLQQVPLELIVINDCSTDATEQIITSYADKYSLIRYYKNDIPLFGI